MGNIEPVFSGLNAYSTSTLHVNRAQIPPRMSAVTKAKSEPLADLSPRTTSYEFLGPPGAFLISFGVPFMTYLLYFGCSETSGCSLPSFPSIQSRFVAALGDKSFWISLWDTEASLMYLAWYAFSVVAWAVMPGDWIEGVILRTGEKKKYKINGSCQTTNSSC